jgi:hypothetical protein
METLKVEPGFNITDTINDAKRIAVEKNVIVEFNFNEIQCLVSKTTNEKLLVRDYMRAHLMEWERIGPDPVKKYSDEVVLEFNDRKKAQEEKQERQRQEWERKNQAEREEFISKTKDVVVEILDQPAWQSWKDKNTDGYGAAIFEYAEGWAKLMQVELSKGKQISECAKETSCWKHGEQLRQWHNNKYGHKGDGTVNPAILTVSAK